MNGIKKIIDTKHSGNRPVNRTITFSTTTWGPPIECCKCRGVTEKIFDKAEDLIQGTHHSSHFLPMIEHGLFSPDACDFFENYVKGGFIIETGKFVEVSRYSYTKESSEGKNEHHLTFRVYLGEEDDSCHVERLLIATVDYSVEGDYRK